MSREITGNHCNNGRDTLKIFEGRSCQSRVVLLLWLALNVCYKENCCN